MFAVKNSAATSIRMQPNLLYSFTTTDTKSIPGSQLAFNPNLMPAVATLSSTDLISNYNISPIPYIKVPFTLSKQKDGTINATYKCASNRKSGPDSSNCDILTKAVFLKNYNSSNDTKLSYIANRPENLQQITPEGSSTIPVNLSITRAFMITTNKGNAYFTESPLEPALRELNLWKSYDSSEPLSTLTNGESLDNLTLPWRGNSRGSDFMLPIQLYSKDSVAINDDGEITGKDYDINLANRKQTTTSKNFIARSRYSLDWQNDFTISLASADTQSTTPYEFIITDNETQSNPQILPATSLPTLTNIHMAVTSLTDTNANKFKTYILIRRL